MLPNNYQPHELGEHHPSGPSHQRSSGFFDSLEFMLVLVLVGVGVSLIPIWDSRMIVRGSHRG